MRPHLQYASLHGRRPTDRIVRRLLRKPGPVDAAVGRWREIPSRRQVKERHGSRVVLHDPHREDGVCVWKDVPPATRCGALRSAGRGGARNGRSQSVFSIIAKEWKTLPDAEKKAWQDKGEVAKVRAPPVSLSLRSFVRSFVRS